MGAPILDNVLAKVASIVTSETRTLKRQGVTEDDHTTCKVSL